MIAWSVRWAGLAAVVVLAAGPSVAGESGHYINGVEGINGASLPPPGVYGRLYSAYYEANTLRDAQGDAMDVGFHAKVMAAVPRLIWMTPFQIMGADYGMDLLVPITRTSVKIDALGVNEKMTGVGDLFAEPLLLSWRLPRVDLASGFGVYLPTGYYDKNQPASPGQGFTTCMFTLGGTLYFDEQKTWSASMLNRYEINSYKSDVEVSPGDSYHFEWGLSKTLAKVWAVGVVGYCEWQVTDDAGSDVIWDKSDHDRAFAAGPEVSYFVAPMMLNVSLRHEQEFAVRDRADGHITTLTLTKIF